MMQWNFIYSFFSISQYLMNFFLKFYLKIPRKWRRLVLITSKQPTKNTFLNQYKKCFRENQIRNQKFNFTIIFFSRIFCYFLPPSVILLSRKIHRKTFLEQTKNIVFWIFSLEKFHLFCSCLFFGIWFF